MLREGELNFGRDDRSSDDENENLNQFDALKGEKVTLGNFDTDSLIEEVQNELK